MTVGQKMTPLHYVSIFICFLMNMLDGMDVLVISYTAPAIAKEWSVSPQALGVVFSGGLLGMTLGAMFLAPLADIIGRRKMIILSAFIMGLSIFITGYSQSIEALIFFRFVSGLGIGSMLASTTSMAAEYAQERHKDFWISFVVSGYPMGAFLSGVAAAQIIPAYGWRAMFMTAGSATFLTLPLIFFLLPESLDFIFKNRPTNALAKANRILVKMGMPALSELPEQDLEVRQQKNVTSLFINNLSVPTLWLWTAFFMSFASLYFLTSWIPKLASEAGLSMQLAIYAGTVFNLGAFAGILTQGYLSGQFGLRQVICGFLLGTSVLMMIFGFFSGSALVLILFGLMGFGVQGGFVGLYSVAARVYPTQIRTTGVGWALGAGRIGAFFGPLLGGLLIGMGLSMTINFFVFAIPLILAGFATLMIKW